MKYIDDKIDIITTKDGSHSLYNAELDETYHSRHGAIQESQYVYIQQGLDFISKEGEIKIFEVGYGTGSNLLLSINYLLQHPHLKLSYTTIEKYPISLTKLKQLNYADFCIDEEARTLYTKAQEATWNVCHELHPRLVFTKVHADIHEYLPESGIDLVYYDAFAPSKQNDIWDLEILRKIYNQMSDGGILVTYCSQGEFKRKLKTLDMEVTTLPGPPFKKEMIRALKNKNA